MYDTGVKEPGSVLVLFRGLNSFVKYWHNCKCFNVNSFVFCVLSLTTLQRYDSFFLRWDFLRQSVPQNENFFRTLACFPILLPLSLHYS